MFYYIYSTKFNVNLVALRREHAVVILTKALLHQEWDISITKTVKLFALDCLKYYEKNSSRSC